MDQAIRTDAEYPLSARRTYLVGVALFIVLLLLSVGTIALVLRTTALSEARRSLDQLSIALAEQTSRAFQAVDLVLQDTANRVDAVTARAGTGLAETLRSPEVNELLGERLRSIKQLDAISIVDASGRVQNVSRSYPAPPLDVADRDFFQALTDGKQPQPFVSGPVRSRLSGNWTVFLARRLTGPGGEFRGLVLGVIALDVMEGFYSAVTTKPGSTVVLRRIGGPILARFPRDESLIGKTPPAGAGQGGRLVAAHDVPQFPLEVEVAVGEWAALAPWRRQALAVGGFALLAGTGLLLLLRALARQLRAQQEARRSLGARNLELEAARRQLEQQARELAETATALRTGERLLAERSATLHTTLENIDQGIMMVDARGTVVAYNQRVVQMLDLPDALLARRPLFREVLQQQWETGEFDRTGQSLRDFVRGGGILERPHVYERERPNGRTLEVCSVPLPGGGVVRTYTDITDRRAAQARIERAALFDELTGLPNRVALRDQLGAALAEGAPGREIAVFYLDFDRFRLANDVRGHDIGDRLLIEAARRIASAAGPDGTAFRIGGDEFAVVHPFRAGEDVMERATRLLHLVAEPYIVGGVRLALTASIGVAVAEPGAEAETVRRNADMAMYRAKDAGGNQIRRYEPAMAAARQQQFQVEQALRAAIGEQAFQLAYQPIVSLERNTVVGYEALLRWTDPARGPVEPQVFIPVAEATGLIVPIGAWVLDRACREAASWANSCTIAVNLSPTQFHHGNLVRLVEECLSRSGLAPERLELEVTEGVLLQDSGAVLETMMALRGAGVSITLDDFGTGHAGLSYLRRFPFDKIKIDRSFVRNLGHDRQSDAIVEATLLLGRRLDLRVVAEGVEDEAQLERLRELRCPLVQGYLTGRPMSAEMARAL